MSAPEARRRSYEIHGVGVRVSTQDDAVAEAIELRLRDFHRASDPDPDVHFEFVLDGRGDSARPLGAGRPVYDTPHGTVLYFPDADALYGELGGVSFRCEAAKGTAVARSTEFAGRRLYIATHPLATLGLIEMLERHGLFSLHAACLAGREGGGVLIAGASGAGKSTLALALARARMRFVSDDIVFLAYDRKSSRVRALGFSDAVGLSEHAVAHLDGRAPGLGEARSDGFPKRLVRIEDLFGLPALPACQPRALVFPRVDRDRRSRIEPLDPREAMLRLVPDVLLTEPGSTQAHLRAIAALLGQVSCYALRSGTDLEHASELVSKLV